MSLLLFEMEPTRPADKGEPKGECNNDWCVRRPALFLHKQNGKYYCQKCSVEMNRDMAAWIARADAPDVCVADLSLTAPAAKDAPCRK